MHRCFNDSEEEEKTETGVQVYSSFMVLSFNDSEEEEKTETVDEDNIPVENGFNDSEEEEKLETFHIPIPKVCGVSFGLRWI